MTAAAASSSGNKNFFDCASFSAVFKPIVENVRLSLGSIGLLMAAFCVVWHKQLTNLVVYPVFRLLFGTLYPAYASYKAVKTKNVREYVKWMMYWIVFALFTCVETFTDVFLSWFPFYYEIKIILVIWLLSPATKGSSILYRKFVHPMLSSREQEIDEYISKAKEQSYKQVLDLGSKGVNALMQTAIKGGGGLVNQIRKSYSLSDLSEQSREKEYEGSEETDALTETRIIRRRHSPRRHTTSSSSSSATSSALYFSEIDVRHDTLVNIIQSADDISSGYSSGEVLQSGQPPKLLAREGLVRTGSIGSSRARPTRVTRSTIVPKKSNDEADESEDEPRPRLPNPSTIYLNDKLQYLDNLKSPDEDASLSTEDNEKSESPSEGEFCDCIEHDRGSDRVDINNVSKTIDIVPLPENSKDDVSDNIENGENQSKRAISLKESEIKQTLEKIASLEGDLVKTETVAPVVVKRGGKYHKRAAPEPPSMVDCDDATVRKKQNDEDVRTIKATLVLKPGVVKTLDPSTKSGEVFCHSPKFKRRTLNVSPSHSPIATRKTSPIRSKSKLDASLSRLMMLPKKMGLWHHKDEEANVDLRKRSSWYDTTDNEPPLRRELSKSDDDLRAKRCRKAFVKEMSRSPRQLRKFESEEELD